MNRHSIRHRLIGLLVLISVSAGGFMGPSLHALAHISMGEPSASSCSCCDCQSCPDTESGASDQTIGEKHDCAICRYLALSKQVDDCSVEVVASHEALVDICSVYLFQPNSMFSLQTAPRGPPCSA